MEFATSAQAEACRRVEAILAARYGGALRRAPGAPEFYVPLGRTGAAVRVAAVGDDDAAVDVYAWIARGAEVTPELAAFLLARNAELRFCALGVDASGDIMLEQALFADSVSEAVLTRLVELVAATADAVEDEIRAHLG